ncbi:hypothetical protein ACHQM5_015765 [Ranunculus cassubicifolius]
MSVERDLSSGVNEISEVEFEVSESSKGELEGGDELKLSYCEDQEKKVGEDCGDIVCDSGENSEGEVKEGSEGSFVMVSDGTVDKSCGSVEEDDVFEEKKEEVVESSDACDVESVSCRKRDDDLVEGVVEDIGGNREEVPSCDDDEKIEKTNVETDLEVEVVETEEEKQLEAVHTEEEELEVVEPKDSYKVQSDSDTKDVVEPMEGSLEDDDEKIIDTKLVADLEVERVQPLDSLNSSEQNSEGEFEKSEEIKLVTDPVQPDLHQLDDLNSTQQSCVGAVESGDKNLESVIGDNQDSQTTDAEGAETSKLISDDKAVKIEDSNVMVSEYFNLAKSGDDVSVEKPSGLLSKEENQELVANVSQEAAENHESEGIIYENLDEDKSKEVSVEETSGSLMKEEVQENVSHVSKKGSDVEKKEDGDSSYVFVDGVDVTSNDPVEQEQVIDSATNSSSEAQKEESQVHPQAVVVGTVVCGPHHTASSTEISLSSSSVEAKLETGTGNNSSDKDEYLIDPINDTLTKDDAVNDLSEGESNESVVPLSDTCIESEVGTGSPLSIRETTTGSCTDTLDEVEADEQIEKAPIFRYLIRVPRYFDDKIEAQIKQAQLEVDEKIGMRDAIRLEVEAQKATCNDYGDKLEAAKFKVKGAYDAVRVKRKELDSVQAVLNSIKNANSVEEIGNRIRSMQHRIEHETIPLKEEKQLIREMKQLKLQSQQLCSVLEDSRELAVDQREDLEKRMKILKQDLDSARGTLRTIEDNADAARKRYFAEKEKLRDMQEQVRSANGLQQEAYKHLQKLKKNRYNKNNYFRDYKDDARIALEYGSAGNKEALHSHCVNQVEKVMELWNKNDDFRNEYLRCNTWSTWKRLGTSEVLAVNPPPKTVSVTPKAMDDMKGVSQEPKKSDDKSAVKQKQNRETSQSKADAEERREKENKQTEEKEKKQSEEEKEVARKKIEEAKKKEEEAREKEEDARKKEEEAAIKRREQLLIEERVKAREAEERKKRNAEKAHTRAELKAQKEAEQKEKEKAKKERRKARKKVGKEGPTEEQLPTVSSSEARAPESTITQEQVIEEPKSVVSKRPQKPSVLAKQPKTTRVALLPTPLRNKNKKRMQTWMWVLLVTILLVVSSAVIFLPDLRRMLL